MKHLTKIGLVVSGWLVIAGITFAQYGFETTWFTPTQVRAGYSSGTVYVYGDVDPPSSGCTHSAIEFTTDYSDPAAVRQMALAAMLSGREMQCRLESGPAGANCPGGFQRGKWCKLE